MTSSMASGSDTYAVPSDSVVEGSLQVPASKSITQRFLNLTLLAGDPVVLERPLMAADTAVFLRALARIGVEVDAGTDEISLRPVASTGGAEIHCGANGTMLRFLTASLTTLPGRWVLDGTERLRRRPIAPLVTALRGLGAEVRYIGEEGFAPISVLGESLEGGSVRLDAGLSSQFASALLMAACRARREVVIRLESLASAPYFELTCEALRVFGGHFERQGDDLYRVKPGELQGGRFCVEGDFSAAAYPAAAAFLTGGRVHLDGLRRDSKQSDRRFFDLLQAMGAMVEWRGSGVTVRGGRRMVGVEVNLKEMPDQVPTLAALAPFAKGVTVIEGVAHLRLKESDRLSAMASELRKLGADVEERPAGLRLAGCWADGVVPTEQVTVETHDDHRVAMSLAICGLRRPGVLVSRPGVVSKSYPSFWRDLEGLLHR